MPHIGGIILVNAPIMNSVRGGLALVVALVWGAPLAAAPKVDFNREIRPLLSDNCFACHGLDAKKRKADLRLDLAEAAFMPTKEGITAIKPRDLAASEARHGDDGRAQPRDHRAGRATVSTGAYRQRAHLRRAVPGLRGARLGGHRRRQAGPLGFRFPEEALALWARLQPDTMSA